MYRKCGILVLSLPGLESTDCCINSKKNIPKPLWAVAPKSLLRVQQRVTSPFSSTLSNSRLFVLLHNIFFTPGYLSKLSSSADAVKIDVLVLFKSLPSA